MAEMETSEKRHMDNPQERLSPASKQKHIAIVTMGVKLADETRGYTRFRSIAEMLVSQGFKVDLITSSFQHWDKAQRDTSKACYYELPYRVRFIAEPGYRKNIDLGRIRSHAKAARNLQSLLRNAEASYDLIYTEIPPNDVARVCAEFALERKIPFVADINDLWPEAMRMVFNPPFLGKLLYWPFTRDAAIVYQLLSGAVGTSDEYAAQPEAFRKEPYARITVYVGNDLEEFDAGAKLHQGAIEKPEGELWLAYAGTLGASYDLETLVQATALLKKEQGATDATANIRIKILGDGPTRAGLEALAGQLDAPVDFLGYQSYDSMAAYLCASDILINSLKKDAAQSIVTKIGDYLASSKPMINTGSSPEFRNKVEKDGFGINVEAEDPAALAQAIEGLCANSELRRAFGEKGRRIAEQEFDRAQSYLKITAFIRSLIEEG